MQANLVYPERVEEVFTPPPGHPPFDIVFDLTGEVRINRNDDVSWTAVPSLVSTIGACQSTSLPTWRIILFPMPHNSMQLLHPPA